MERFTLSALAAVVHSAGCMFTSAQAQEVTLRVHTFMPPVANPYKHFLTPWAEKVGKDSNGRIKVQLFPSMQLGGAQETEKFKKLVQPVYARFKHEVDKSGSDGGKAIADAQALVAKYSK
jgi:TRAP-type C4-dicarboxylate transport system substrate-binding protein